MFAARRTSGGRLPLLKQGAPTETLAPKPAVSVLPSQFMPPLTYADERLYVFGCITDNSMIKYLWHE